MTAKQEQAYSKKILSDQGFRISNREADSKQLFEVLQPSINHFQSIITGRIAAIYPYRQAEQTKAEFEKCDGINFLSVNAMTGEYFFTICVSVEALNAGHDYAAMVFIHELAHTLTGEKHTEKFNNKLNELLKSYNEATGSAVVNGYDGIRD